MTPELHFLLQKSLEQLQSSNLVSAEDYVNKALKIQPMNFDGLHILGVIKGMQGNPQASIKALRAASEIKKNDFSVQFNLAKALMEVGAHEESLKHHRKALSINPRNIDSLINYAKSLNESGSPQEALLTYEKALNIDPAAFEVWAYRGIILNELSRNEEALKALNKALEVHPKFVPAIFSSGVVFYDCGRFQDAITQFDRVIDLGSGNSKTWLNKGMAHHELKEYELALSAYGRASQIHPGLPDAEFLESLTLLTLGKLEFGLKKFEARWLKTNPPKYLHPELPALGSLEQAAGKTILVWEEEGFGDAIQFSRYLLSLVAMGVKVVFEVRPELMELFRCFENITLIARGEKYEQIDFQVPLQSLPLIFDEQISTISNANKYLDVSDQLVKEWALRLDLKKDRLNIGVATFMNPEHINSPIAKKIMPLANLEPLLQKANLFVIQKSISEGDTQFLEEHPEINHLGNQIKSFADSAAIIENMDLIISVDTSLAHLAGALEKRVLILLPYSADWRWFLNLEKTPWYSSAKLFRQSSLGIWDDPVSRVMQEIMP